MSNQEPQERTDPVEELDELMTDESAEPGMSYTIEYDDTDRADAGADDTAAADPEAIAAAAADDAGTGDEEAEAVANTAAAALDETLHAGAGTTSADKPDDADGKDDVDDVDDSVFRAYPMFSMRGVTVADAKTGEHIWNDLTMRCEAGTSYGVLVDAHNTRQHDTLVALMAGFAHPAEGSVMTKATPLHDLTPLELRGHRIGVLLQQFALRGDLSAAANLEYAMGRVEPQLPQADRRARTGAADARRLRATRRRQRDAGRAFTRACAHARRRGPRAGHGRARDRHRPRHRARRRADGHTRRDRRRHDPRPAARAGAR